MSRKQSNTNSRASSGHRETERDNEEGFDDFEDDNNPFSDSVDLETANPIVGTSGSAVSDVFRRAGSAIQATLGEVKKSPKIKPPVVLESDFRKLESAYESLCNRLSDLEIARSRDNAPTPHPGGRTDGNTDLHKDVRKLVNHLDQDFATDIPGCVDSPAIIRCKPREAGNTSYCLQNDNNMCFPTSGSTEDRMSELERVVIELSKNRSVLKVKDLDRTPSLQSRNHNSYSMGMGPGAFSKLLERFEKSPIKFKYGDPPLPYLERVKVFVEQMGVRLSDIQYKTLIEWNLDKSNKALLSSLYPQTQVMDYKGYQEFLMVLLSDSSTTETCIDKFYSFDHKLDKSVQNLVDLVVTIYDLMNRANLSPESAHSRLHHILPDYCQDVLDKLKAKAEQTSWTGIGVETIIHSLSPFRTRIDSWLKDSKKSKAPVHWVKENTQEHDKVHAVEQSLHSTDSDQVHYNAGYRAAVNKVHAVEQALQSTDLEQVHYNAGYRAAVNKVHAVESLQSTDIDQVHYNAAYRAAAKANNENRNLGAQNEHQKLYRHPNAGQSDDRVNIHCFNCLKRGHTEETCLKPRKCLLCNKGTHTSPSCTDYPGTSVVSDPCPICKETMNVDLFHTLQVCKFNTLSPFYIGADIKKLTDKQKNNLN